MSHLMHSSLSVLKHFFSLIQSLIQKHVLSSGCMLGRLITVIRIGSIMKSPKQVFFNHPETLLQAVAPRPRALPCSHRLPRLTAAPVAARLCQAWERDSLEQLEGCCFGPARGLGNACLGGRGGVFADRRCRRCGTTAVVGGWSGKAPRQQQSSSYLLSSS